MEKVEALSPIVFGASGLLGGYLFRTIKRRYPGVIGTYHNNKSVGLRAFDFKSSELSQLNLRRGERYYAIVCSAITSISQINEDPAAAALVNVVGTLRLIEQLKNYGIPVLFISSDNVFSGKQGGYLDGSVAEPVSEYGRQKREVERVLLDYDDGACVLRLAKIMGDKPNDATILNDIAGQLLSGQLVRAARDLIFNPTAVEDIAQAVLEVLRRRITGVRNLCNPQHYSRLVLTYAVAEALGLDDERIQPVSFSDIDPSGKRPLNTTMINSDCFRDFAFKDVDACIARAQRYWRAKTNEGVAW